MSRWWEKETVDNISMRLYTRGKVRKVSEEGREGLGNDQSVSTGSPRMSDERHQISPSVDQQLAIKMTVSAVAGNHEI